jgi:cytochrome c biogenesis protein CcdA
MLNNFFTTSGVLSQLNRIDTGVIVVYLILMITVGVVFARFVQQWKGFIAVSSIIVVITGFWFWFNNREKDN